MLRAGCERRRWSCMPENEAALGEVIEDLSDDEGYRGIGPEHDRRKI